MKIRPATVRDVPGIAALIEAFAQRGKMLFRSHAELYEAIRDFFVAEEEEGGRVVGICALEIVWADLAEVRSLAVEASMQGKGIGKMLVNAVVEEARRLEIHRVFALTYEQAFFERLGFAVVDKSALPLKVWSVCIKCPKRDGCDEIAMVRTVMEKPPPQAVVEAPADSHAELRYDVPTPLVQIRVKD
ncbi:MAG TPA: N-acetyltransferase [Phycisphaerae bacterium]|nr:N-acetyltransferase [Phycisphaerae bacterium]